mmetsp:Transcript_26560/g.66011  ORF Transcript_26560/g.66011 Transcript_26560/m.66011 type:complete len:207 (-) Transcript_26560:791-1411(-)
MLSVFFTCTTHRQHFLFPFCFARHRRVCLTTAWTHTEVCEKVAARRADRPKTELSCLFLFLLLFSLCLYVSHGRSRKWSKGVLAWRKLCGLSFLCAMRLHTFLSIYRISVRSDRRSEGFCRQLAGHPSVVCLSICIFLCLRRTSLVCEPAQLAHHSQALPLCALPVLLSVPLCVIQSSSQVSVSLCVRAWLLDALASAVRLVVSNL